MVAVSSWWYHGMVSGPYSRTNNKREQPAAAAARRQQVSSSNGAKVCSSHTVVLRLYARNRKCVLRVDLLGQGGSQGMPGSAAPQVLSRTAAVASKRSPGAV